jgi:hypothetical protein
MAQRNPDRFVRENGSGGLSGNSVIQDPDGDFLQINPDGSINVSGVTLSGPVTVSNEVEVKNDTGNPIPVDVGNLPTDYPDAVAESTLASVLTTLGDILSELQGTLDVLGTVAVSNFPATQPVSGTVEVTNDVGNPLPVSGTVSVAEPVSVDDNGASLTVDAINLDIRDLSSATDSVAVTGTVSVTEPVSVDDNGASLTVDGTVAVSNMIPAVETGLAKDATVISFAAKLPDEEGTWSYAAGTSGTVNVPALGRVIGIAASTSQAGGTVQIDGGDSIPIPVPTSGVGAVDIAPRANLIAPSIVFANTDSFIVEIVT